MTPVAEDRQHNILIYLILILSVLWDFYHPVLKIRPFDMLLFGVIVLACFVILIQKVPHYGFDDSGSPNLFIVSCIIIASCLTAIYISGENYRSIIGIIMAFLCFLFFYKLKIEDRSIERAMNILLVINFAFILFQYATFQITRQVFNPFEFLGIDVRLTGGNIFRPAGLFREPASFALMIFSFIIIKIRIKSKMDFICWLGILAIFLSLSLWGAVAATCLIIFLYWRSPILQFFSIVAASLIVVYWNSILKLSETLFLLNRIVNIEDDGSANERYAGNEGALADPVFWFGHGPNIDNYQYFGGNGLGYLLATWGLLGGTIILLLLAQNVPRNKLSISIFGVTLALLASTIWTQFYWWVWLALLFKPDYTINGIKDVWGKPKYSTNN